MTEQEHNTSWEEYENWRTNLSPEDKEKISQGEYPEGAPQIFKDIDARFTVEDKLLRAIFGEKDSMEEILSRPADYREIKLAQAQSSHKLLKE